MRILLATPELEGGGIAAYTRSLAGELADLGHSVLVAAPGSSRQAAGLDDLQSSLTARLAALSTAGAVQRGNGAGGRRGWPINGTWAILGLDVTPWRPPVGKRFCSNVGRALPFAQALARAVRQLAVPPDVVEAPEWDAPGALLALEGTVPLVTRMHGHVQLVRRLNGEPFRAEDKLMANLERLALRRSTLRAANSAYLAEMSSHDHRLDPASVAVLPLGVDVNRFRPGDPIASRDMLGLPQGVPIVGFAGRLEARKGLPLLIEAWRGLVRRHPTALLAIAGGTSDGSALEDSPVVREMRAAVPAGRLKFVGPQPLDRMPAFYRAADVFCAPSVGEPFGLVVLEAMASGRPVVSLQSGGVQEIVEDAVHGFLTEPGYVEALESVLLRLLGDDLLRLKMGEAGRAQAIGAFSVRHMAKRTVEAYEMAATLWQASFADSGGRAAGFWVRWLSGRDQTPVEKAEVPDPDRLSAGKF